MQISTSLFSYHSAAREFTACASTLHGQFDGRSFDGRSFELVSQRTGKAVEMLLRCVHHDGEGDLTHWEFLPVECNAFHNLIVFND